MKAPGKHNRATAAHIPDGISERDGFAGQVHREFFVQSSKIASWPPSTPSTGSPSSTLGGTNSMRRFEFRRTGFPRDELWLRSFRRFFLARGDATELFKIAEEVFDEMTPFVHVETEIWRARPAFGGMRALAPRRSSSTRSQSLSKALSPSRASNAIPSINGSTPTLSWRWPGRRTRRTRLPSASTIATILVVRPPRDRPMA